MNKFIAIPILFLCFAGACLAQNPWTGILDPSRAIDWRVSGLPATLPDGETMPNPWTPPTRSTICSTIASSATVATINTALAGCPAGQVVKLPCDKTITNAANNTVKLGSQNNVTLRGCGADRTTIYMPNGGGVTWQNPGLGEPSCTWTSGYAVGTTVITANCAPSTGTVLQLTANGVIVDPGSVPFFCSDQGICTEEGGTNGITQMVIVTGTSGSGPFSVTIFPALYLNFGSPQTSPSIQQQTNEAVGDGLEDVTVDCSGNTANACLGLSFSHYCWMKGVRVINAKVGGEQLSMSKSYRNLVANNLFYGQVITNSAEQNILITDSSDDLIINNIGQMGFGFYTNSPTSGEVFAYNLLRDGAGSSYAGCCFANSAITEHGIASFSLVEGNQMAQYAPDLIHGTHALGTMFRTLAFGTEPPFKSTANTTAVSLEGYSRFYNIVGNVLGTAGINNKYVSTPASNGSAPAITLGVRAGYSGYQFPTDPLTQPTTMLWGNYDVITNAVRWCGTGAAGFSSPPCSSVSEVPSALLAASGFQQSLSGSGSGPYTATLSNLPCIYGDEIISASGATLVGIDIGINGTITGPGISSGSVNCSSGAVSITFTSTPTTPVINYLNQTASASGFQNPVPASTTLPPSFVLPTTAHPSGGTGLSWWKVSTNYPTNSTFQTPPFPPIGPDVMGGPETNGSYDIPAFIAWKYLPVDPTYQTAYSITGSSWAAGTETLTVTVNASFATQGEFQISSGPCAGTFLATNSTATTLQYAIGSNPGSCSGVNVLYPDIRAFNENVYQNDSGGGNVSLAPASQNFGTVNVGSSGSPVTFTVTNTSGVTATSISPSTSGGNSGDFTITNSGGGSCSAAGGSIATSASCTFTVTFSPTGSAARSTTLSISYSGGDGASPQASALSGTGGNIIPAAPATTMFAGNSTEMGVEEDK